MIQLNSRFDCVFTPEFYAINFSHSLYGLIQIYRRQNYHINILESFATSFIFEIIYIIQIKIITILVFSLFKGMKNESNKHSLSLQLLPFHKNWSHIFS
jgi:glycopeptide antibiotics resistance protein